MRRVGSPAPLSAHVLNRGGHGVQSLADRRREGGALGREALRPSTPRTDVTSGRVTT